MYSITIISSLDKSANENRALQLKNFFNKNYSIKIFDTKKHFSSFFKLKYFIISPKLFLIYFIKNKLQKEYPLIEEIKLRNKIFLNYFNKNKTNILICQNPYDMLSILSVQKNIITIYDSPTIFYKELLEQKKHPNNIINYVEKIEKLVYKNSSITCFHWYTFFNLAKSLNIKIKNPVVANWSINKIEKKNKENTRNGKIVYIGNLNSDWINQKMLQILQKKSNLPIDIYSYEKPNYKIKYKKYLQNLNKLSEYSFGLISITNSPLRNSGFSAKQLEYFKHGLPVLCPEWRKDSKLSKATIYFNLNNFNQQLNKYLNNWQSKHKNALNIASRNTPSINFNKLSKEINKLLNSHAY